MTLVRLCFSTKSCSRPIPRGQRRPVAASILLAYRYVLRRQYRWDPERRFLIEAQSLCKSFNQTVAVENLSFLAEDGDITGLIGHNGAGKTTTFRILAGLLTPDCGRCAIDRFDVVADRVAAQSRLGILPDVRGLYPRLTAREHVRYFGSLHGLKGKELEARLQALIDRLGMADFADRRARGYSRGQELKVALARALVHDPKNLILDEPTNGLDVPSTQAVHDLILERKKFGSAILISSHIMSEVTKLCDKLVILAAGRLVMQGTPHELMRRTGHNRLEEVMLTAQPALRDAAE
jgi:sodium transport system ATP-binding protein